MIDIANPEQMLFASTTQAFLEKEASLNHVRGLHDSDVSFQKDWWQRAAELGWASLLVPEELGGGSVSGDGVADLALVAEQSGRTVAPGPRWTGRSSLPVQSSRTRTVCGPGGSASDNSRPQRTAPLTAPSTMTWYDRARSIQCPEGRSTVSVAMTVIPTMLPSTGTARSADQSSIRARTADSPRDGTTSPFSYASTTRGST